MSINNNQELEARIHNFLERKLERFPEIASLNTKQERSSLTLKSGAKPGADYTVRPDIASR